MSLNTACPFCNLKERIIKENAHSILFLSNPRKMPGHFLVAPKRHLEKPWDLADDELLAIFELIKIAQRAVTKHLTKGCDVRQTYRPFIPQGRIKIDHVHYHILPRDLRDEHYTAADQFEAALFKELTPEEHDNIAALING